MKKDSKSKFSKDHFRYNEETDRWMCPSGQNLEFIKEYVSKEKKSCYMAALKKSMQKSRLKPRASLDKLKTIET